MIFFSRVQADNGYGRIETVSIENDDVVIDGVIMFSNEEEGQKYKIHYGFDQNGANITIENNSIFRVPPALLKSLTGWFDGENQHIHGKVETIWIISHNKFVWLG